MNVSEIVTDKVIEALNKGTIPWERPWIVGKNGSVACNLITKKPYKGINVWLTACQGFASPYWLTFNQCRSLKGSVNKGEKSTMIVYWHREEKPESKADKARSKADREYYFLLRYFNVFNVLQCNGLDKHIPQTEEVTKKFDPIELAEEVIAKALTNSLPVIMHKGDKAYYSTVSDEVILPPRQNFTNNEGYYSTAFHEFGHATGHSSRIGRGFSTDFGSHEYSKEELIAEMTAAFLCAECGMVKVFDNQAAYIKGWIMALQNDPRMVVMAAAAAQKAVDYIKGGKPTQEEEV